MKRPLLSLLALGLAASLSAQVAEVASLRQVDVAGLPVNLAKVSPDGTFAVVSDLQSTALTRVDLASGLKKQIADNGSALHLTFTPDSRAVVFKSSVTGERKLRYHSVESVDLASGVQRRLSRPARTSASFSVSRTGNLTLAGESALQRTVTLKAGAKAEAPSPVVTIYRGHLQVTMPDGSVSNIDPQGKGSYLWPSLSPDGTKIAYYKSNDGCYVCNLDGSDARKIGFVHAPAWLGNNALVGCQDYDNGDFITSSSIVAADLQGNIQTLTDPKLLGVSPSASADGKTVTFSTADGKLYVLTLK